MGRGEISLVISRLISCKGLYILKGSRLGRPAYKFEFIVDRAWGWRIKKLGSLCSEIGHTLSRGG